MKLGNLSLKIDENDEHNTSILELANSSKTLTIHMHRLIRMKSSRAIKIPNVHATPNHTLQLCHDCANFSQVLSKEYVH